MYIHNIIATEKFIVNGNDKRNAVLLVSLHSRSCVRIVSSTRAGMGKTLFVSRMADKLQEMKVEGTVLLTIPIHGPHVTTDSVMQYLVDHQDSSYCTILHFDISPSVYRST